MKIFLLKTFIIFVLLITLNSCCKVLKFEKNETYWTDVYEKGDIVIFKSSNILEVSKSNNTDTIFILNKTKYIPTGDCSFIVTNIDAEGCVIDYRYKHNSIMSEPIMLVQHFKEDHDFGEKENPYPILRVYNTEFSGNSVKDTTIVLKTIGIKLNDCYTFHSSSDGWGDFKLKTYVWSRKMGLVMFEGYNGEKFEFLKKIKTK